jgi:hypothetical protein
MGLKPRRATQHREAIAALFERSKPHSCLSTAAIERVEDDCCRTADQQVERRLAGCAERDDFAIDDRVTGQLPKRFHHTWKATGEFL